MRSMGKNQRNVLRALRDHRVWPGGWIWENRSTTVKILDSLVKRGLVTEKVTTSINPDTGGRPIGEYRLSDAGHWQAFIMFDRFYSGGGFKIRPDSHIGFVHGDLDTIKRYLPDNFHAYLVEPVDGHGRVRIFGVDKAGWTWDEYVLPRLASGGHFVQEAA